MTDIAAAHSRYGIGEADYPDNIGTDQYRPSTAAIGRAIPAGCRRATGQRAWLTDVMEAIAAAGWRTDRRDNWESVVRIVAYCADWRTKCTMPVWDRLGQRAGRVDANGERRPLSRSTVARVLAWLREQGFLGIAETGSTPWLRPMAMTGMEGNRAAVYVLTTKGRQAARRVIRVNDTPSGPRSGLSRPCASARGENTTKRRPPGTHPKGRRPAERRRADVARPPSMPEPATERKPFSPQANVTPAAAWRARAVPKNRSEEKAAARVVMNGSAVFRGLSQRHAAHVCRDYFRAGWSAADILCALDHKPGGELWRLNARIHHPAGWAFRRLDAWRDGDGGVLPSPASASAASAAAQRAEQDARRTEAEQIRAAAAPRERQASGLARALAAMAAASPNAARVWARRSVGLLRWRV